jgi:hypothetical protein
MSIIPLDLVRQHIRQDETIDNDLLSLYVEVAVVAAEEYCGRKFRTQRFDGELPVANGLLEMFDADARDLRLFDDDGNEIKITKIGRRRYRLGGGECSPYSEGRHSIRAIYDVGPLPNEPLDPVILAGCLKMIAHMYEFRGADSNTSGQVGLNSSVVSSGATEFWNLRKSIAF